jgi:predicted phage baseplate assembly protein
MISACPCDNHGAPLPANLPGLSRIVMRRADWRAIRRALLAGREDEIALKGWRPGTTQDLALMAAEWWATLGEVLEFYNDEIANEAFLGTAIRPESVTRLISLLGYVPRPALAATGVVAAVVSGKAAITLPAGFAIESLPAPGLLPQTFETDLAQTLAPGGRVLVQPPGRIARPDTGALLLAGKVRGLAEGDVLRVRTGSTYHLVTVAGIEPEGAQTRLAITGTNLPASAAARGSRIERAGIAIPVWSFGPAPLVGDQLHLSGLTRAIAAGDRVLLTARGRTPILTEVTAVADVIWYANPPGDDPAVSPGDNGLPVPHSRLTLANPPSVADSYGVTVHTGWSEVAPLIDQPPQLWNGVPSALRTVSRGGLAAMTARPVLLAGADASGGAQGAATASAGSSEVTIALDPAFAGDTALASPIALLANLIAVTRGKTVQREVLGSGDATRAGQSFVLAKAPVSYTRAGAGYASNVTILVDGVPWREAASFYGEAADAAIFVLSQREDGKTQVAFGDGINGRRLPTGQGNVVARYRYGAGAAAPAADALTRLPSPWPGLDRVLNPVAASGGADAEAADAIRAYAPQSVLTLGRAVSVHDFAAFAAAAAAPRRTRTLWAWDETQQRTQVTIFVEGDAGVRGAVLEAVNAVGDPLKPVRVQPATAIPLALDLTLVIAPGYEPAPILAAARAALTGAEGLFAPARLGIGQALFLSALSEALVAIPGVVTLAHRTLSRSDAGGWGGVLTGPLLRPADDEWFDLADDRLTIGWELADG